MADERTETLRVLHVSPEVAPFSKVGGLGDVAGALPPALRRQGVDCRIVTPAWDGILDAIRDRGLPLTRVSRGVEAVVRWEILRGTVWKCLVDDLPVYLLDSPLFGGRRIYPNDVTADSVIPFLFLSLAALDLPESIRWRPRIIHCHDWTTAPVIGALTWHQYYRRFFNDYRTVFTIHNLAHQGILPLQTLNEWGIAQDAFQPEAMEFYGDGNLMKGAIVGATAVTTVSPTYAREIQTDAGGEGLGGLLRSLGHKTMGIMNGIDTDFWNPETDPLIPANYTRDDLSGKDACRAAFMRMAGWEDDGRPLFVSVGRLVEQKGLPILLPALEALVHRGCRFFFLGSGQPEYEWGLNQATERWPDAVQCYIGYDEPLGHLAYSAGDFFLMPSRFEPCGLSQLISFRYGTIPVARYVGGIADSVFEHDGQRGNGFLFYDYSTASLVEAVSRAQAAYRDEGLRRRLQARGMEEDHSWNRSAPLYKALYASLF